MSKTFDLQASLNIPAQLREQQRVAYEVHAQILNSAKAAQENLYQMAMGFKRMRDEKLYIQLGYENFGDYCEKETGMSRMNVYRYISVAENLPENFVTSMLQTGVSSTKLYLLSTLTDEEREQVTDVVDVEDTTVKELRAEIDRLRADKKAETDALKVENINLKARSEERISELENQIDELENRPLDVTYNEDNSDELLEKDAEIERLKEALAKVKSEIAQANTSPAASLTSLPKANEVQDDFDENVKLLAVLLEKLYKTAMNYESTEYTGKVLKIVTNYYYSFRERSKEIRNKYNM